MKYKVYQKTAWFRKDRLIHETDSAESALFMLSMFVQHGYYDYYVVTVG
jgi:hypothetical protein